MAHNSPKKNLCQLLVIL